LWQAAQPSTHEKGGTVGNAATLLPELMHQLPQGIVRVAEPIGDFLLRMSFHKDGAQRFVLSVIRLGGLGKELPATAVIHDQTSLENVSWFSRKNQEECYCQISMASMRIVVQPEKNALIAANAVSLRSRHEGGTTEKRLTATPRKHVENHSPAVKSVRRFPPAEIGVEWIVQPHFCKM
jgi:hypothetical protein